jgi:hypothetical protein
MNDTHLEVLREMLAVQRRMLLEMQGLTSRLDRIEARLSGAEGAPGPRTQAPAMDAQRGPARPGESGSGSILSNLVSTNRRRQFK